ncbi:MAG: amidase family protein, partial [Aestuariivirgaceae bacterium]
MAATLMELAAALNDGRTSARELVEQSLDRIGDEAGEGARAFLSVDADAARADADHIDGQRKRAGHASPYAGIPFSVKDLFDMAGQVTRAGSVVLNDAPAAAMDAVCIGRLRAAGFIALGRTNMTEFAYSGVGLNPHHGTPLSVYDRKNGRIP